MPFQYTIDAGRSLAKCSAHGVLTLADIEAHQKKLADEPEFKAVGAILWDFSDAKGFDHSAARFIEKAEVTFAGKGKRRALVTSARNEVSKLLHLWVLHREVRGDPDVKFFSTLERAQAWLDDGRAPT